MFLVQRPDGMDLDVQIVLAVGDAASSQPATSAAVERPFEAQTSAAVEMILLDPDGRRLSVQAPLPSTSLRWIRVMSGGELNHLSVPSNDRASTHCVANLLKLGRRRGPGECTPVTLANSVRLEFVDRATRACATFADQYAERIRCVVGELPQTANVDSGSEDNLTRWRSRLAHHAWRARDHP